MLRAMRALRIEGFGINKFRFHQGDVEGLLGASAILEGNKEVEPRRSSRDIVKPEIALKADGDFRREQGAIGLANTRKTVVAEVDNFQRAGVAFIGAAVGLIAGRKCGTAVVAAAIAAILNAARSAQATSRALATGERMDRNANGGKIALLGKAGEFCVETCADSALGPLPYR